MATRAREGPPGKERRGISPTFPRHTGTAQQRRSPNPSPGRPGSTDHKHDSVSSEEHIPNYLRPTISSTGLDHHSLHHTKKAASASDAVHKPSLSRRRSFDRPPPPHVSKTHISPNPRERSMRSSSSFTSKSTTSISQKTLSDRLLKSQKDGGKKQGLYPRPRPLNVKKSSIATKKQDNESSSSTTKAAHITSSSSGVDPDIASDIPQPQEEEPQSIVTDEEVMINAGSNYEIPSEDEEHIDHQQAELEMKVDEEIKITESSAVAANPDASHNLAMEEPEDHNSPAEEANIDHVESEEHVADENSVDSADEGLPDELKAEEHEKAEAEDASGEALDKKEEATSESQIVNSKETEEVENAAKEVNQEAENVAAKRPLPVIARKESSVSNDVIEETASKLREQRKNKVKALAGAFETVISLQDPKS